jgi:hypothetical protein
VRGSPRSTSTSFASCSLRSASVKRPCATARSRSSRATRRSWRSEVRVCGV